MSVEEATALEETLRGDIERSLRAMGYEVVLSESGVLADHFLLRHPDQDDRWLSIQIDENPYIEPAVGSLVDFDAEGCTRQGVVEAVGPGYFRAQFTYKSGTRSSAVVMTGRDRWRLRMESKT
jgi:hypothetical protein